MNKIIGREVELNILNNMLTSDKSELIAIYGRRRVGKTFLVRETYKNPTIFEVSGIPDGSYKEQLQNFFDEIAKRNTSFLKRDKPNNWYEAFNMLGEYIEKLKSKQKKVIFIDELPWLHTHKSKFVQFFAHFWNTFCAARTDLVVVVCGSAASFMINKVIHDKKGLHHRITRSINLRPFNLHETELFLKSIKVHLDRYSILQLYMAIGGIPHYLEKINPGDSATVAINKLCFEKDGFLSNEFNHIFASLFNDSGNHVAVVEALAKSKKSVSRTELVKTSKIESGGTLTKVINELIESGFISEYRPYNKLIKDTLYRLTDEYAIFYLKFIKNNKGADWKTLYTSNSYVTWSGFTFENICIKHEKQLLKALGITGINASYSSWRNENAQIDLLINRSDRTINICELKFSEKEYVISKAYASNLENKKREFINEMTERKNVVSTIISTFGVKKNEHYQKTIDNQLTMDYLFEVV